MANPYVLRNTQDRPRPLKHQTGAEVARDIVIASSLVTLDDNSRRLVSSGTLFCKVTSGDQINKYGPYLKTASNGQQTLTENGIAFVVEGHDVTLGDRPGAGWYAQCVFDMSELTMQGYSLHSTPLTNIKAVFPTCYFDD